MMNLNNETFVNVKYIDKYGNDNDIKGYLIEDNKYHIKVNLNGEKEYKIKKSKIKELKILPITKND